MLNTAMLNEFGFEVANTRKVLERIPEEKFGWRPHEKSMTLGELAMHLAMVLGWGAATITTPSFDLASPEAQAMMAQKPTSRQQILDIFDKNAAAFRTAL